MSIQLVKSQKTFNKILDKTRVGLAIDGLSIVTQKVVRYIQNEQPRVYYHYFGRYTHPHIRKRMYGAYSPVKWQNFDSAQLAHFLQRPESTEKPYLIEPNDQILTIGATYGVTKPSELIRRVPQIIETIAQKNFKGFLLGPDGLSDQFKYYFGDEYFDKIIIYPYARFIPKVNLYTSKHLKSNSLETPINFICLAGDYYIKAVDILIESWLSTVHLHDAILTIACPNIPKSMLERLKKEGSIKIISTAPLGDKLKAQLLSKADVSIGLTHIDGGANLIEGMEYGHAVITNTNHRSAYFSKLQNCHIINFPNEYYKPGYYGKDYDSMSEYLQRVDEDKRCGKYEDSKQELSNAIMEYIEHPALLRSHFLKTLIAIEEQSVWTSNAALLSIYKKSIES